MGILYDISGSGAQNVQFNTTGKDLLELNLSFLKAGVYALSLHGDRGYFRFQKLSVIR